MAAFTQCPSCQQPLGMGLFCQYCGHFVLDPKGTVVMASRLSRLGAWLVNAILFVLTLGIGWIIWWFIVAPRGQNPGKALVGLRVIKTDGRAMTTWTMFLRGLVAQVAGLIPFYLDELWLLWDRDAQTIHDKIAATVVVRAQGSEHVVEQGSVGPLPAGVQPPPAYAPPVSFSSTVGGATAQQAGPSAAAENPADVLRRLKQLRDEGLISEEEYEAKRRAAVENL